jgi:hypothetical protein
MSKSGYCEFMMLYYPDPSYRQRIFGFNTVKFKNGRARHISQSGPAVIVPDAYKFKAAEIYIPGYPLPVMSVKAYSPRDYVLTSIQQPDDAGLKYAVTIKQPAAAENNYVVFQYFSKIDPVNIMDYYVVLPEV